MSDKLRSSYDIIADDYLAKKQNIWKDFTEFMTGIPDRDWYTILDVGAGNGRNLNGLDAGLYLAVDLSFQLLLGYVGPPQGQKIAAALPHIPLRKGAADLVISIAVIHHLTTEHQVVQALEEMRRVNLGEYIFSVWRRWRRNYREKLFTAIREGRTIDPLINHHRPWYTSDRQVVTTRFYHYYTFKELKQQLNQAGLTIKKVEYLGGRHDDANIFVLVENITKRKVFEVP